MGYAFTCPLDGCDHFVMTSGTQNTDDAAHELSAVAKKHLQQIHPDVHKTPEEVDEDIRSHMVETK